jgi:glycosyltransferase involved in cell wall biosynthesis
MSNDPLISVVTPSFNQSRFIECCIQSVLDQHWPSFEHIIYDNCSTDGTLAALRRYPHLIWVSEPDRGQSHALNKALRRARGTIIAWLNADDAYEPGAFGVAARELTLGTGIHAIAGRVHLVDQTGRILRTSTPNVRTLDEMVAFWRRGFCLEQCGVLLRREVLEEIGLLDEHLHYAMDYEFLLRLVARHPLKLVPDVLARFTIHPGSKTSRLRHSAVFVEERRRASSRYWGPRGTIQYQRRQRACDRRMAEHFANAVLRGHADRNVLDWAALWNITRHDPVWLVNRHVLGVLAERAFGRGLAGRAWKLLRGLGQ